MSKLIQDVCQHPYSPQSLPINPRKIAFVKLQLVLQQLPYNKYSGSRYQEHLLNKIWPYIYQNLELFYDAGNEVSPGNLTTWINEILMHLAKNIERHEH